MTNEKDKLTVPGSSDSLVGRVKIGGSSLHSRLAQQPLPPKPGAVATQDTPAGAAPLDLCATLQNRLGLMLDISGSMGQHEDKKMKIDHLKEAIQNFLQSCDFSNTSCALEPFPPMDGTIDDEDEQYTSEDFNDDDPLAGLMPKKPKLKGKKRRVLTNIHALLSAEVDALKHHGGTPMAECMQDTLSIYPLTRGILVSDGEADNRHDAVNKAYEWKHADIVVDCVHIGRSVSGEATLKEIARITGGMFIKFDNVSNFAKNFKFLTPSNRLYLVAGGANLIGAKEVK